MVESTSTKDFDNELRLCDITEDLVVSFPLLEESFNSLIKGEKVASLTISKSSIACRKKGESYLQAKNLDWIFAPKLTPLKASKG